MPPPDAPAGDTAGGDAAAAGDTAADRPRVIAIDGPSASGKSTTAHEVAGRLGLVHLNSGRLYRAVTWTALRDGWIDAPGFEERLADLDLDLALDAETRSFRLRVGGERPGPWLQSAEVTARVSEVSARQAVRDLVNEALRAAARGASLVIDGRDIGTAVFPDAFLKIFLTASAEARARRRLAERRETAESEAVAAEASRLRQRDRYDSSRILAPLARAADAVELDSTERGRSEVVDEIVRLYEARRASSG